MIERIDFTKAAVQKNWIQQSSNFRQILEAFCNLSAPQGKRYLERP
jgi:hypothetical protein